MTTLSEHIMESFGLDPGRKSPFLIPADRWTLFPALFNAAGFKVGAEVGVGGGRFARHLCEEVVGLRLYAVDPWLVYDYYEGRYDQAHMDRDLRKAMHRLRMFDAHIIREYSHLAAERFADGQLDFVHIDANRTFQSVMRDLEVWTPER